MYSREGEAGAAPLSYSAITAGPEKIETVVVPFADFCTRRPPPSYVYVALPSFPEKVTDLLPSIRAEVYMIFGLCGERREGGGMSKRKYSEVEMIGALKQMEAGRTAADLGREWGVSKHTIYAWRAKHGGMSVNEAQRLRQLEDENGRLKKLVADLSLDKEMLKAVIEKNGWSS